MKSAFILVHKDNSLHWVSWKLLCP